MGERVEDALCVRRNTVGDSDDVLLRRELNEGEFESDAAADALPVFVGRADIERFAEKLGLREARAEALFDGVAVPSLEPDGDVDTDLETIDDAETVCAATVIVTLDVRDAVFCEDRLVDALTNGD